jgi:hypothetical protein
MGTLVFVCPTTGHEVSSGIEIERSSFRSLPRTSTAISCPHCGTNHALSAIWAWLVGEAPEGLGKTPPSGAPDGVGEGS